MLAEGHSTEVALEHLLAGALAVGLHVSGQLAALSARVRTKLTFVRLLSCVTPPMHGEIAAVLENLPAELARVVLSAGHQFPTVLRVKESLYLSFLHYRLDGAGFHGRQVRGQDERLPGWILNSSVSKQLAGRGPETGGLHQVFLLLLLQSSSESLTVLLHGVGDRQGLLLDRG